MSIKVLDFQQAMLKAFGLDHLQVYRFTVDVECGKIPTIEIKAEVWELPHNKELPTIKEFRLVLEDKNEI